MIIKSINYLRFGILFARLKKEERRDNSWFFYSFYVSNRVCVPLGGFEHYFFYVFYVSNASPTMWVWALFLFLFLCNCENLKILPFVRQNFGGVDWPPRPPSNTANMYRKISAVIMALQGAAGGRLLPQNFAWKKGEF